MDLYRFIKGCQLPDRNVASCRSQTALRVSRAAVHGHAEQSGEIGRHLPNSLHGMHLEIAPAVRPSPEHSRIQAVPEEIGIQVVTMSTCRHSAL